VGARFIRCVGCVPARNAAESEYASLDACKTAHPKGSDYYYTNCKYRCDPATGCVSGETGPYSTLSACQTNCTQEGGSGPYGPPGSSGIDPPDPPGDPSASSPTEKQTIQVLIDAYCDNDAQEIVKTYATITID